MKTTIRALLARALDGRLYVMATDDFGLAHDCGEVSASEIDLGLLDPKDDPEGPGLFLWTGTSSVENHGTHEAYEPGIAYDGTARPVTTDELPELLAMTPPICPVCGGSGEDGDESGFGPCDACNGSGVKP